MSIRYYNRSAPFWDWVASMEEQGREHPWFSGNNERGEDAAEHDEEHQQANAFQSFWPFGNMPHRGRFGPPQPHPPPHPHGAHEGEKGTAYDGQDPPPPSPGQDAEDPPEEAPEAGPSQHRGPHGRRGGPGRHGHGHGPGHGHAHAHGRGGWGGWGGRGRGGRCGGRRGGFPMSPFAFGGLGNMFQEQLFGGEAGEKSDDFKPEVDVFDTPEAFVIHVSLPGAKKEDVGVDWNADKSELSIAGVIYRPNADEEFLKTLALDERKVGAFERKVRLGSRANPAQVDVDGITAKLEDGVLRVEVPKLDGGFVDIKKVDIE